MGHSRRPVKRRRLGMPSPFFGFSSFARSLLFSLSAPAPSSPSSNYSDANVELKPPKVMESIESEDEEREAEMVQADFAFFDPKPSDFSGVKLLLQNYLDNKPWDLSGFVDLILEQTTVGTVVKLDDSDEQDGDADDDDPGPFAVISALNLQRYEGHKCVKELKEFLLQACQDDASNKKLKSLLEQQASEVGLLVCQRFVNCPYQLVPPLYDALFDEISWATEDEPTPKLQDSFRFKYYLLLTRFFESKSRNNHKAKLTGDFDDPIIYVKPEDEIFQELSSFSFTFPLHAEKLAPQELKNYTEKGLVMVVKADDIPKFREKIKSLLAES
ncbi:hypothetical protein Cni_G25435 [Canna indica]|uniref:Protein BCCIP homolog n=1 Tax=Canna indica TaxID=4628 RepID=A0AAQ3KX10_9LILI|nr:hypothetical protein Cni_G25435 [Canna indica]